MSTIQEKVQFAEGIIKLYRNPFETEEEYNYWWMPETDNNGVEIRLARMSEQEKSRYQEAEGRNQIMNAGRTQVLTYIGALSGNTTPWAKYFAIGTGAISYVSPTDTSLANEVFRKQPSSYSVSGTQVTITIQLGTTDAQVTMTNSGLFGNAATGTLSSGTLYTHALFSYTKGAYAVTISYIVNLL